MNDHTIYTVGYGNKQPATFGNFLKDNGIVRVFDVRRIDSKARLRAYDPGKGMRNFLNGFDIEYGQILNSRNCLGNYSETLENYKENINPISIKWLADMIVIYDTSICLLCSELHAYVDAVVNCHRVYVAYALQAELLEMTGEMWEIVHL